FVVESPLGHTPPYLPNRFLPESPFHHYATSAWGNSGVPAVGSCIRKKYQNPSYPEHRSYPPCPTPICQRLRLHNPPPEAIGQKSTQNRQKEIAPRALPPYYRGCTYVHHAAPSGGPT